MNRRRIHNDVNPVGNITRTLAIEDLRSVRCQLPCQLGFLSIGTADPKASSQKNLCETAHADTADAYKMHPDRVIKI